MTADTTPQEELEQIIERRIKEASTETISKDEIVQIAWLADGIDLWHRSNHKRGHSPAEARRYIISSITRLIARKVLEGRLDEENIHHSKLKSGKWKSYGTEVTNRIADLTAQLNQLEGRE